MNKSLKVHLWQGQDLSKFSTYYRNFSSVFHQETSQAPTPPPPPNVHMTFLVDKIDMWHFPKLGLSFAEVNGNFMLNRPCFLFSCFLYYSRLASTVSVLDIFSWMKKFFFEFEVFFKCIFSPIAQKTRGNIHTKTVG